MGIDQYGRPVEVAPYPSNTSGYYGDSHIEQKNIYGPSIDMDQYGRPVQIIPKQR